MAATTKYHNKKCAESAKIVNPGSEWSNMIGFSLIWFKLFWMKIECIQNIRFRWVYSNLRLQFHLVILDLEYDVVLVFVADSGEEPGLMHDIGGESSAHHADPSSWVLLIQILCNVLADLLVRSSFPLRCRLYQSCYIVFQLESHIWVLYQHTIELAPMLVIFLHYV